MEIAPNEIFALDALPARGAVVVTHSAEARSRIQREIVDRHGSEVAGRTKVVVVRDRLAAEERLTGVRVPVVLDPSFPASVPEAAFTRAIELARGANLVARKR